MKSYVIELGLWSGEGQYRKWESGGYYRGYTTKGPVIVHPKPGEPTEAYYFPSFEYASRVLAGDARLKGRIVEVTSDTPLQP